MRILLNECVPWPLHKVLVGHACSTTQKQGWGGIGNGTLLKLAEKEFDLFITSDQNMAYQQKLAGRRVAILQLSTNKLRGIRAASQLIQSTINSLTAGQYIVLEIP
jgi:hypothetical protein